MSNTQQIKERLIQRLAASISGIKEFLMSEAVLVEPLSTPFILDGGIVKLVNRKPRVERISYIGWAGTDFAIFLSGNRKAFSELVSRTRANIGTPELVTGFVRTLLDTTANLNDRYQVLNSSKEIPIRPGCAEEEARRIMEVRQRYESEIKPMTLKLEADDINARIFTLIGQNLVRLDVHVQADGRFSIQDTVLEENLAMPYVMP